MKKTRNEIRLQKHRKIRTKISGTSSVPRLSVFKSNKNFSAQLIDDSKGTTLIFASSSSSKLTNGGNIEAAVAVGSEMGQKIKALKIKKIVFDRSGYKYHGRVKAFAESVRKEGAEF